MGASVTLDALGDMSSIGGQTFSGTISVGALLDQTLSGSKTSPTSIAVGVLGDYVNNTNHGESVSVGALADWASTDAFLWNEVTDVTTTWTKVP